MRVRLRARVRVFSCVVAPFNESHKAADCPVWDARAERLHKLGVTTVPTITLPPGYVGTCVKLLLSSAELVLRGTRVVGVLTVFGACATSVSLV